MKKYFYLPAICIILFSLTAGAQQIETRTVEYGESLSSVSYYLFPEYTEGVIKMKDGSTSKALMNFNLLICQVEFVAPNNDTLVIGDPNSVETISIDNKIFFYANNIYYEVITAANSTVLATGRSVSYVPVKTGALGLPTHVGSGIETYSTFFLYTGQKKLVASVDLEINMKTEYVLIDNSEYLKANKNSFLKVFPSDEEDTKAFIKSNKVNFNNAQDLEKLFQFCASHN